ncbi:hypothetical protein [Microvirga sp. TS319]|uniref:hypothetical protein n=1 Tax=Microvirga sp. TS319 TaxID=3241165 RepID=UPI00351A7671
MRQFRLINNPRQREPNRVNLLTSGADCDVVFVADSNDSEYARYGPDGTLAGLFDDRSQKPSADFNDR